MSGFIIFMNDKVSNINFTSNIRIISRKEFNRLSYLLWTSEVGEMSKASQIQEFKGCASTDWIMSCIAGVAKNLSSKKNKIFHFLSRQTLSKYVGDETSQKELEEVLIKNSKNKIKGLLLGGCSGKMKYIDEEGKIGLSSGLSLDLLAFLKKPFRKSKKADFSYFLFQKHKNVGVPSRPVCAFLYDEVIDTYYLNCIIEKEDRSFINIMKKADIRDHFKFIHVSDEDKVFIGLKNKKPIKNNYWNNSNVRFLNNQPKKVSESKFSDFFRLSWFQKSA